MVQVLSLVILLVLGLVLVVISSIRNSKKNSTNNEPHIVEHPIHNPLREGVFTTELEMHDPSNHYSIVIRIPVTTVVYEKSSFGDKSEIIHDRLVSIPAKYSAHGSYIIKAMQTKYSLVDTNTIIWKSETTIPITKDLVSSLLSSGEQIVNPCIKVKMEVTKEELLTILTEEKSDV